MKSTITRASSPVQSHGNGPFRNMRRSQRGILLPEVLVYMSAILVVTALAGAAFYKALDFSKHLHRVAGDITTCIAAGERWRSEIRATTNAVLSEAVGSTRMLLIPGADGPVVYRFGEGKLERATAMDGPWVPVMEKVRRCEFHRDEKGGVVSWRWELELAPRRSTATIAPMFTFQAVPPISPGTR